MSSDKPDFTQSILDEFFLDTKSTTIIDTYPGAKLLQIDARESPLIPNNLNLNDIYILDSEEGRQIACHPHIVGNELERLCYKAADVFKQALESLELFPPNETGILHILRGGRGYMVADVMPPDMHIIDIRIEYTEDGYREHSDDSRGINVTFTSFPELSSSQEISTLIIPDTIATGRSAEAAIKRVHEIGASPKKIVLYGFISIPGLLKLAHICSDKNIDLYSFAICDLTQLAWNNYDMPLYGIDEGLYEAEGKIRKLGSIIHEDTLHGILPQYVAGLDQPGDWSERQLQLFNGNMNEAGNINGHCLKSIQLIESLDRINRSQPWYNERHGEIAQMELMKLRETISNFEC